MRKIVIVLLPVISLSCLFGSSKLLDPEAEVARVEGRLITYAEMDSVMELIRSNSTYGVPPDSVKESAMDSLIFKVLIDIRVDSTIEALENDLEFSQSRRDNVAEVAKKVLYNNEIAGRAPIDSSRVSEYYQNHQEEFVEQERVKASHILLRRTNPDTAGVKSEKKREELAARADDEASEAAEAVLDMALSGRDWDSLASAFSEDKSNASEGGDLGYFFRGRMVPEFDSVAFTTEPGKIVGPVSTKFGYHIIKVDDYVPKQQKPLDSELFENIRERLTREEEKAAAQAYVDSLKAAGQLEFNEEVLNSDEEFSSDTWVMSVNSEDTLFYRIYAESLPKYRQWKQVDTITVDDKKEMLGFLSNNLVLISAARTLGYYKDPEVVEAVHDITRREAKMRVDDILKDDDYDPTDEEVEEYYLANIKDYTFERPLLVHHIIFEDSVFAAVIRDSIAAGADFVEMARKYYPGEPEIREVAYNLDYIGPEDMGHEFFSAAGALKVGELSDPVKTRWGYHIIRLMSKKEDKTVKQVRPGIKHKLKNARNHEYRLSILREWQEAADIKVDQDLYAKIAPPEKKIISLKEHEG